MGISERNIIQRRNGKSLQKNRYAGGGSLRGVCFQMIKGKKTPESMKLVFRMAEGGMEKLLLKSGLPYQTSDVEGLFLMYVMKIRSLYLPVECP